jgi:hypothetical protein
VKGIVYTRHDGGVSVCHPAPDIFAVMQSGGYWDDRPAGFVQTQIDRQIADGIDPDHARRFAHAVAFGGCTEAEAWDILRDRDCARHGYHHDVMQLVDLPDRWFRDAWARGHNGGPVYVDLGKARPIQWQKIVSAIHVENAKRELDLFGKAPVKLQRQLWQRCIRSARDDEELRRVFPTFD